MSVNELPEVAKAVESLRTLVAESVDLRHAADLIEWDERVYMPPGGAPVHAEMAATLRRLSHEQFTSARLADALAAAEVATHASGGDTDVARMVAVTRRDFDKATELLNLSLTLTNFQLTAPPVLPRSRFRKMVNMPW